MASTDVDASTVEPLEALTDDVLAMLGQLVAQSGWNQTPQDWALFARVGTVFVVRDAAGHIVASGAVLPMGERAAWIGMILVTPDARGQGLGHKVFAHCLATVQAAGRTAMLDATPAGEALYRQFDFEPLWRLTRWQRAARPALPAAAQPVAPAPAPDTLDTLAALDAEALGFARGPVLRHLVQREGSRVLRLAAGFAIVRAGRVAHHIGPVLAANETVATDLLDEATGALRSPVFVDVPDDRPLLRDALLDAGFTPQRGFLRMALGADAPMGQRSFIHAIAGPEFG